MIMATTNDFFLKVIETGLNDSDSNVRAAAMRACEGRDIPLEFIEKRLDDSNWYVRVAALKACEGKDVPLEFIEKGLNDVDWDVREAAMSVCRKNHIKIPVSRTFTPPKLVYKKCVSDVIVVAEIPQTAHIRGAKGMKSRASEAIIVDIRGDVQGEKVGISKYDLKTIYRVGDHIVIDDFDFSNQECAAGFHFFCTLKEAKKY